MIKRIRLNKKNGFTLIELIVVMAVVGVLVLLAVPKFLGKTEQAKLTQIQHDIRVVEGKLNEVLVGKPDTLKEWEPAETAELTELVSENKLMGRGGPTLGLPEGDVWVIDDTFLAAEVRTKLTGDFFVDANGNVFYEHSKPVAGDNDETPPKPSEKPIPDYYVQATNTDFKEDSEGYWRYIGSDDYVILPHEINGVPVTSYHNMFKGNLSGGVTSSPVKGVVSTNSNVTDMRHMFTYSKASSLDLSNFDTSNVTTMYGMFDDSEATSLDLSSFDTSNVTDMKYMFSHSEATSLDLSSFDTSNVTNMAGMFRVIKATSLDLSNFDTSNVTDMYYMFGHSKTTSLDLSNFDTSKVTNMSMMFHQSQSTTLDLSSFDTANVKDMSAMFWESEATSLDLTSFDTSNVTDMSRMFARSKATTLDLSSFDTAKVTNMSRMFQYSNATVGIARTTNDANRFNNSSYKSDGLTFIVKQ